MLSSSLVNHVFYIVWVCGLPLSRQYVEYLIERKAYSNTSQTIEEHHGVSEGAEEEVEGVRYQEEEDLSPSQEAWSVGSSSSHWQSLTSTQEAIDSESMNRKEGTKSSRKRQRSREEENSDAESVHEDCLHRMDSSDASLSFSSSCVSGVALLSSSPCSRWTGEGNTKEERMGEEENVATARIRKEAQMVLFEVGERCAWYTAALQACLEVDSSKMAEEDEKRKEEDEKNGAHDPRETCGSVQRVPPPRSAVSEVVGLWLDHGPTPGSIPPGKRKVSNEAEGKNIEEGSALRWNVVRFPCSFRASHPPFRERHHHHDDNNEEERNGTMTSSSASRHADSSSSLCSPFSLGSVDILALYTPEAFEDGHQGVVCLPTTTPIPPYHHDHSPDSAIPPADKDPLFRPLSVPKSNRSERSDGKEKEVDDNATEVAKGKEEEEAHPPETTNASDRLRYKEDGTTSPSHSSLPKGGKVSRTEILTRKKEEEVLLLDRTTVAMSTPTRTLSISFPKGVPEWKAWDDSTRMRTSTIQQHEEETWIKEELQPPMAWRRRVAEIALQWLYHTEVLLSSFGPTWTMALSSSLCRCHACRRTATLSSFAMSAGGPSSLPRSLPSRPEKAQHHRTDREDDFTRCTTHHREEASSSTTTTLGSVEGKRRKTENTSPGDVASRVFCTITSSSSFSFPGHYHPYFSALCHTGEGGSGTPRRRRGPTLRAGGAPNRHTTSATKRGTTSREGRHAPNTVPLKKEKEEGFNTSRTETGEKIEITQKKKKTTRTTPKATGVTPRGMEAFFVSQNSNVVVPSSASSSVIIEVIEEEEEVVEVDKNDEV